MNNARRLIHKYYNAFNNQDVSSMLDCLSNEVVHEINQGEKQVGKPAFLKFMERMNTCYEEQVLNLQILVNETGDHAAAEFIVEGVYISSDHGLPPAHGQHYSLPVGAFFSLADEKITRVTNYYNLQEWLRQVDK